MTYGDYLTTSEMTRWILDSDIAWDAIDPALALGQPDLLDRVRDSALIESFFPIFTPRALDVLWDNVTATAIYSIQLYESYKHFHVFAQYLEAVGYRPIADEEVVALRRRNLGLKYDQPARLLTRYMMSEHFAAHNFYKDSRAAAEPVLRHILQLVAKDEVRHCQFGYELLDDHLRQHPGDVAEVLDEARALQAHRRTRPAGRPGRTEERFRGHSRHQSEDRATDGPAYFRPSRGGSFMNPATRNLAWKLNWFRQSELEGSLLLGRMVGTVESRDLTLRLTRHCAEEAEHSCLWAEVIDELNLPHIRIFQSYQSFYLQQSGPPATLLEVLSFTQVFERRVHRRFHAELRDPGTPPAARVAYARMIEDEKGHLDWVADWLRTQAGAQDCLGHFEEIDHAVFQRLQPFEQCLWAVAGLGREPAMEPVSVL